jgi:hypothetical protein
MEQKGLLKRVWGIFSPILMYYILALLVPGALGILFPSLLREENAMWLLTLSNLLTFPVLLRMYLRDRSRRDEKKKAGGKLKAFDVFLVLVGAVCISRALNYLIALTPLPYYFTGYEEVSDTIYGCSLLSQVSASVFSAALLEEVLMRGLVYTRFRDFTGNIKLSMAASALIFGLFHGNVVQGVYAFALGLFLALVYEAYQSLIPAVLAHMAANGTAILMERTGWLDGIYSNQVSYCLVTAAFFLVGAGICKIIYEKK